MAEAKADAEARIAAVVAERDATMAKASASAKVRAAEAERDEALKTASGSRGRRDRGAAGHRAGRGRRERRPGGDRAVRADAARVLSEARAERQADAYRDELAQLRTASPDAVTAEPPVKAARRRTRGQAAQRRLTADQYGRARARPGKVDRITRKAIIDIALFSGLLAGNPNLTALPIAL